MFGVKQPAISKHLNNIYKSGELEEESTYSILEYMGNDGKQVYKTKYYNLDAIISVGYRVNSVNATAFRRWATSVLRQYLLRGYAIHNQMQQLERQIDNRFIALQQHTDEQIHNVQQQLDQHQQQLDFFIPFDRAQDKLPNQPPIEGIFYEGQVLPSTSLC